MEIKCDSSIIKDLSDNEKIDYMNTLLNAVRHGSDNKEKKLNGYLYFAFSKNIHPMIERFRLISLSSNKKRSLKTAATELVAANYLSKNCTLFFMCAARRNDTPDVTFTVNSAQAPSRHTRASA